jgi:hypothetical protein
MLKELGNIAFWKSGSVSDFRRGEGDTYSVGSLRDIYPQPLDPDISMGPKRIVSHSAHLKKERDAVSKTLCFFSSLRFQTMDKVQKPTNFDFTFTFP